MLHNLPIGHSPIVHSDAGVISSPIQQQIERSIQNIAELSDIVETLEGRLSPVLRSPDKPTQAKGGTTPASISPLGMVFQDNTNRIEEIAGRLMELIERLDC